MKVHEFVICADEYSAIANCEKTFRVVTDHKENHKYSEEDILTLHEATEDETKVTGRALFCAVTYIQRDLGIPCDQRVVLGIEPLFEIVGTAS